MCKRIFANQTKENGDIPFYKIGTLGGLADAYISNELFKEYRKKYNYPLIGETLITCSGTIGRCIQFDGAPSYYQDSNIVWLRKRKDLISNDFLFRLIQKNDWDKLNATTISRLYNADLLGLKFYVPSSVEEQAKISTFLTLLDKRIGTQNKIIDKLESLKNNICRKLMITLPKIRMGDICNLYQPQTLSQQDISTGGKYLVYGANGILGRHVLYNHEESEVCVTCRGSTCGTVFLTEPKSWINGNAMVIHPIVKTNKSFLCESLKTVRWDKYITGSGQPQLIQSVMENIKIATCKIAKQNSIGLLFDSLNSKITMHKKQLDLMFKEKKYLLSNLFI